VFAVSNIDFSDDQEKSLEESGQRYNITRKRIRQIEKS
jgi:DNA-directed RNA polymerase sigma subunit (sigma70/sigma32)